MKFAVSAALVVMLLVGMPLGCVLAGFTPSHPCCPRTSVNSRCPYDALDNAKVANVVAAVPTVAVASFVVPPSSPVTRDLLPEIADDQPDLYVLNRILRI